MKKPVYPVIFHSPDGEGRVELINGDAKHHYSLSCNFSQESQLVFVERLEAIVCFCGSTKLIANQMKIDIVGRSKVTNRVLSKLAIMTIVGGIFNNYYIS